MNGCPRMRTLPEAARMLKELDSNTAFTLTALRRMVNTEQLPAVQVASKRLIDFDLLLETLAHPQALPAPGDKYGEIRRIN